MPHGNRSYVALVDAGMAIIDISDVSKPKTISRLDWSPPYGGYAHTTLPLPGRKLVVAVDESVKYDCQEGEKRVWLIDVREEKNPVIVSTCPVPEGDFCKRGLRFGPHNVHENRPGSFQSENIIFVTYYNAGLRVFDIRNKFRPEEVGYFIPPAPEGLGAALRGRLIGPDQYPGLAIAPVEENCASGLHLGRARKNVETSSPLLLGENGVGENARQSERDHQSRGSERRSHGTLIKQASSLHGGWPAGRDSATR
jgi:hypothetical protein